MYPYNQMGQIAPSGHGYTPYPGYNTLPGHQIVQFGGPNVNAATTTSSIRSIQAAYPTGSVFLSKDSFFFF